MKRSSRIVKSSLMAACLSMLLAACTTGNTNQSEALNQGDYAAILPYDASNTRGKHVGLISDIDVRNQMETGLMDLSKAYFDPNEVAYKTHVFLDYDELDATDGSRGLLGTLRDENPNGLNPGSDEVFDTGNGEVVGPVLILDLYEIDFYKNDQLAGISIGLIVPDEVSYDGEDYAIAQDKMNDFLGVAANKIVSYLRERFNDISARIPVLVAAYQLNTESTDASKGGYIYSVYFNGASTDYQTIDEEHYIVPGSAFSAADPTMAAEFTQFKADIIDVLPDATYVTGEARYVDGVCTRMNLTVTTHGKTAGETMAAVQAIRQKMSAFTSEDTDYRITVENNNQVYALLHRPKGTYEVSVITTY